MFKLFGTGDEQVLATLACNYEGVYEFIISFSLGEGEMAQLVDSLESSDPRKVERYCREKFDALDEAAAMATRAEFFNQFAPGMVPGVGIEDGMFRH